MVTPFGPLATASHELRQARKGATVAVMPGAGEQLARATCDLIDDSADDTRNVPNL